MGILNTIKEKLEMVFHMVMVVSMNMVDNFCIVVYGKMDMLVLTQMK